MAPIAVNDTLSYAYVAGTADSKCGKCYHLQYDGHFANEMENNPPRETHKALKGKHMIVMASNIGMDVAGGNPNLPAGQFDLMVPGGGVGAFDALTTQVKKGSDFNWGAGFGGFLTECQNQLGYDATLAAFQTCIKDMCDAAFGDAGLPNLLRGCHWFADWYMAADNPTYYIEEVECPQYLIDHPLHEPIQHLSRKQLQEGDGLVHFQGRRRARYAPLLEGGRSSSGKRLAKSERRLRRGIAGINAI